MTGLAVELGLVVSFLSLAAAVAAAAGQRIWQQQQQQQQGSRLMVGMLSY